MESMKFKHLIKKFKILLRKLILLLQKAVLMFIKTIHKLFLSYRDLPSHHPFKKSIYTLDRSFRRLTVPVVLAFLLFYFVHPTFAQLLSDKERLAQLLATGNVTVGAEKGDNGFSQIYYVFENKKNFVTNDNFPHGGTMSQGENIVWMEQIDGLWQVFMHNIMTGNTLQLTFTGNNVNPKVSGGKVVWESWDGATWQLYLYDGKVIRQITQGDLATNADIEGDYIVFARKNHAGLWRSEAYSILENKTVEVDVGNDTEYPHLDKGDIYVGPPLVSQKKFPLKVQDIFLVDSVSTPQSVTLESIQKELDALGLGVATSASQTASSSANAGKI